MQVPCYFGPSSDEGDHYAARLWLLAPLALFLPVLLLFLLLEALARALPAGLTGAPPHFAAERTPQ